PPSPTSPSGPAPCPLSLHDALPIFVFHGADRVGDPLDGVGLAVGEVVHRVDAPPIAGPVMGHLPDPVHRRIPQVEVRRGHVDPGDRKSTRLNSSHVSISYAVSCLKK